MIALDCLVSSYSFRGGVFTAFTLNSNVNSRYPLSIFIRSVIEKLLVIQAEKLCGGPALNSALRAAGATSIREVGRGSAPKVAPPRALCGKTNGLIGECSFPANESPDGVARSTFAKAGCMPSTLVGRLYKGGRLTIIVFI